MSRYKPKQIKIKIKPVKKVTIHKKRKLIPVQNKDMVQLLNMLSKFMTEKISRFRRKSFTLIKKKLLDF